jgi:hypothetical protein
LNRKPLSPPKKNKKRDQGPVPQKEKEEKRKQKFF